jgi:hypothetical protein
VSNWFLAHWYIGAAFSVCYTAASVAWSLRVERQLKKLHFEQRILEFSHEYLIRDLRALELLVSREDYTDTERRIKAQ